VAALGRIWVQLDAYETDLARIRLKDTVTIQVASFPGEQFEGKVTFIDPVLDPASRTARVRIEVSNKKGRLRPGMFAEAVIHTPEGKAPEAPLVVAHSAVLFTGERSLVFVEVAAQATPTYEAREVQLGPRAGNAYPVVSGLVEGERVVTHGAFTLDAELQIRGGKSMMTMPDDVARELTRPFELAPKALASFGPVVEAALALHVALSKDDLAAARQKFSAFQHAAQALKVRTPSAAASRWKELSQRLVRAAKGGAAAKSLEQAREQFHELSVGMVEVLRRFGNPLDTKVRLASCPMATKSGSAQWLQAGDGVENPYLGSKMFDCGDIQGSAAPQGFLPQAPTGPESTPPGVGHRH
jgi:Cu(I)/Ag(I) efflux system membrane fusion protein